jgi:anti-anti-sigma factor
MTEFLSVDVRTEGDILHVAPVGEIDLSNATFLREALIPNGSETKAIELNLGGITFIDSTGLRTLLEAEAAARSNGHALRMTMPSAPVRRIFEVAGFTDRFDVRD